VNDGYENSISIKDKEITGQLTNSKLFNQFSVMWIS